MKYICFCNYDTVKYAALSHDQVEEIQPNCRPYDDALRATGKVDLVASFTDPETWQSVRPRGGEQVVTDGPYMHAAEQTGALFILEAGSMEEAMQIASNHAAANYGEHIGFGIEVRACIAFDVQHAIPASEK